MASISASFCAAIRRSPSQLRLPARRVAAPSSSSRALSTTVHASKEVIATDKAPAALGPYSQAIKVRVVCRQGAGLCVVTRRMCVYERVCVVFALAPPPSACVASVMKARAVRGLVAAFRKQRSDARWLPDAR